METTPSTRRLVAAGKSVPTPGNHRAWLLEFNRAGIQPDPEENGVSGMYIPKHKEAQK